MLKVGEVVVITEGMARNRISVYVVMRGFDLDKHIEDYKVETITDNTREEMFAHFVNKGYLSSINPTCVHFEHQAPFVNEGGLKQRYIVKK